MTFSTAEILRRFEQLIIPGTVAAVDLVNAKVRVDFGDNTSDFLPWLTARAGDDQTWVPPSVGEQVLVFSPSGNPAQGFVMGSIYQSA